MSYHPHDKHLSDIPPTGPPLHVKVRAIRAILERHAQDFPHGTVAYDAHKKTCPICSASSGQPLCPDGVKARNQDRAIGKEKDNNPAVNEMSVVAVQSKVRPRSKPRRIHKQKEVPTL